MTPSPGPRPARLDIGDAIHDGWLAFRRSPWPFVIFAILLTLLQLVFQPLTGRIGTGNTLSTRPVDWVLYLIGMAGTLLVNLWGAVGLVRGAWQALEGQRVSLELLTRWDGPALGRVFRAWLLLALLIGGPLVAILLLLGGPMALLGWLGERSGGIGRELVTLAGLLFGLLLLVLLGVLLVATIYLSINQKLLTQIAVLEERGPLAVIQRGRRLVDPHWPLMLLLAVIEGVLVLLGVLACFVGFFVAWPVVVCISTAAYRQLLGRDDLTPRY
ncbi:MAG: hypothetical protein VKI81_05795 [Synechococcaceae cyanobacterium]|nr:hypothetical protein [Synechococcaceae cyanobacterium]